VEPLQPPGLPAGATAEQIAQYQARIRQYEEQYEQYLQFYDDYIARRARLADMPVARTLYGFNLGPEADDARSDQGMIVAVFAPDDMRVLGYVELTDVPTYGREIVTRAALAWVLASAVATLLAAGAGWLASRRITAPLRELTEVTAHMAAGNLATRAEVRRQDEIGILARSFNEMAGRIEAMVHTLRRFVADAAHELNTPLTALQINLDLALEAPSADQRADFLTLARSDAKRLEALSNDLLDLSRVESAPAEGQSERVDLVTLIRELGEPYTSQAEQAGLTFELNLPVDSAAVRGERAQLRRALGNLLDNAIKFTPAGGTVGLHLACDDGWVRIAVTDTGIGIPAEELPRLFSRFHRGRNATAYPGSGLGLAIVNAIVARHGGQVGAQSTAAGSCFVIRWPCAKERR
jgi:signal transduction histidine kinase